MSIKYKSVVYFFILILVLSSIYLGYNHSVYNQDYHHTFFILSSIIDYDKGLKLFREVFLQYGPGQVFFFNFLGNFIEINLVSISLITSIIFSLNLFVLFIIFKKISSINISFLLIFIIYLIHPYSIYPWPDYLSGLCVTLFFYFLLNEKIKFSIYISSIFLFLAVMFRSTYILNILFSIILYSSTLYSLNKKNNLKKIFNLFFLFLFIFFILLYYSNSLLLWFNQSLAQISTYASETKHTELYTTITSYVGEYGFVILKILYYLINSVFSLLNISKFENIIFVTFILVNFTFFIFLYKKKFNISEEEKKILFISLLGMFGFIQSLMLMETFRNINATMGIFIAGLFLFKQNKFNLLIQQYSKLIICIIAVYVALLIPQFPLIDYKKKDYETLNSKYFLNKKLTSEVKNYYEDLKEFSCNNNNNLKYLNISNDFAISYLCDEHITKFTINSSILFLKKFNLKEYKRLFINHKLNSNELLFTSKKIASKELQLIRKFKSPHVPKEWYGDAIYIYKKFKN